MGLWSGLKTLGSSIVSGVKSFSRGAGRLRDAAKYGTSGRPRYFGNLVREAPEAEIRAAAVNAEKIGLSEKISNGVFNEEAAAALDKTITAESQAAREAFTSNFTQLRAARTAEQISTKADAAQIDRIAKAQAAEVEDTISLMDNADISMKPTGVNAKEISEAAIRDTGYGLSSEEKVLMKNRPNYVEELREQGRRERVAAKTALGDEAAVNATGTTQPDVVAAAKDNMGSIAEAESKINRVENEISKEGVKAASSTAGQAEAAQVANQAQRELDNVPAIQGSFKRELAKGIGAMGATVGTMEAIRRGTNNARTFNPHAPWSIAGHYTRTIY